jgi:hypothetical protein
VVRRSNGATSGGGEGDAMTTVSPLAPIPVVLRVPCSGCGARAGTSCPDAPPVCSERMEAAQDEFEAQRRATKRSVALGEWSEDEPTVPGRMLA